MAARLSTLSLATLIDNDGVVRSRVLVTSCGDE